MDNKIGYFIFELRKESGLTQEELAKRLCMVRENVSKMERGINKPTIETLLKLSNIFDVSINELLSGKRKNNLNSKEIDNSSFNFNYKKLFFYKRIILVFSILFVIIIFLSIGVYKNQEESYIFNSEISIILILKNNYGYLSILDKNLENKYIFYYIEKFDNPKNYSFTFFDIHKPKNNFMTINKEVVLFNKNSLENINYFKYDKYKKNMIINNSYLKIINESNEKVIKINFKDL